MSNKKRNVLLYIFLSLSILMNAFLVFQAALPGDSSLSWSNIALNVVKNIVPTTTSEDGTAFIGNTNASDLVRKLVGHFFFYFIDGILVSLYTHYQFYYSKKKCLSIAVVLSIGLFFSILTELIQLITPHRAGDVVDMLINFGGFLLGTGLIIFIFHLINRHHNKKIA